MTRASNEPSIVNNKTSWNDKALNKDPYLAFLSQKETVNDNKFSQMNTKTWAGMSVGWLI